MNSSREIFQYLEPRLRGIEICSDHPYLFEWFDFYWKCGTVFHEADQAVCVIKLFRRLEQFFDDYVHDPCGEFASVEAASCETGSLLYPMYLQFKAKWGPQRIVLWDRGPKKTTVCPRMFTWERYEKLVRKFVK